uniref:Uncharacterized protein n=1 Tax=Romanomermis culicivorax TaxID=13658 RepID=A0A915I250_ROMCU
MSNRRSRAFFSEPVDFHAQVMGRDLDLCERHFCTCNKSCKAEQSVVEQLPSSVPKSVYVDGIMAPPSVRFNKKTTADCNDQILCEALYFNQLLLGGTKRGAGVQYGDTANDDRRLLETSIRQYKNVVSIYNNERASV